MGRPKVGPKRLPSPQSLRVRRPSMRLQTKHTAARRGVRTERPLFCACEKQTPFPTPHPVLFLSKFWCCAARRSVAGELHPAYALARIVCKPKLTEAGSRRSHCTHGFPTHCLFDDLRDDRIRSGLRLEQEPVTIGWLKAALGRFVRLCKDEKFQDPEHSASSMAGIPRV